MVGWPIPCTIVFLDKKKTRSLVSSVFKAAQHIPCMSRHVSPIAQVIWQTTFSPKL